MKDHLFEFVSFRSPQILSRENYQDYFVSMSDEEIQSSTFYSDLDSSDFQNLKDIIKQRSRFFERLSIRDLEGNFSIMINFHRKIQPFRFGEQMAELADYIETHSVERLPVQDRIKLWDNFIFHIGLDDRLNVEITSSILIADKFLQLFNDYFEPDNELSKDQQQHLKQFIKHGKLILDLPITSKPFEQDVPQLSIYHESLLREVHDQIVNEILLDELESLNSEIGTLIPMIRDEKQSEILQNRESEERLALEKIAELNSGISDDSLRKLLESNRKKPEIVVKKSELSKKLSDKSQSVLRRIDIDGKNESLQHTYKLIEATIKNRLAKTKSIKTDVQQLLSIQDTLIHTSYTIPPNAWVLKAEETGPSKLSFYLTHYYQDAQHPRIHTIEGSISHLGQTYNIKNPMLYDSRLGFQTFLLNAEPINARISSTTVSINLSFGLGEYLHSMNFDSIANSHYASQIPPNSEGSEILSSLPIINDKNILVSDFYRVEQEVSCYQAGEVSHIENIMASEYKERVSRKLLYSETETESISEFTKEQVSDTESTEKQEMKSEAQETLNEEIAFGVNNSLNVNGDFGVAGFNNTTDITYDRTRSREESNSQAFEFAKSVTNKIQNKITEKRTKRRKTITKREFEDINKHGYDNKEGQDHVVGIFRWVDKIYLNELINYGKRMAYDFMIPEPAVNFIWSRIAQAIQKIQPVEKIAPPVNPGNRGLNVPADINEGNYLEFSTLYNTHLDPPPLENKVIAKSYSREVKIEGPEELVDTSDAYYDLLIPEGYLPSKVFVNGQVGRHGANDDNPGFALTIANFKYPTDDEDEEEDSINFDEKEIHQFSIEIDSADLNFLEEGVIPISFIGNDIGTYSFNVITSCKRKNSLFRYWQYQCFNAIMEDYNTQMSIFESKIENQKTSDIKPDLNQNSIANREIEKRELKLSAILMLTRAINKTTGANLFIGQQHYYENMLPPIVKMDQSLEDHSKLAAFLETVFEWELMAYSFYPYYYLYRNHWYIRMDIQGGSDSLFKNFLSAGFAKVRVPVRKGYEEAFEHFLKTGHIWESPPFIHRQYASLTFDLGDDVERRIVETWKSKIPTNLTILQQRAAGLDAEGLPCQEEEHRIAVGNSILQPANNSNDVQ